MRAILSALLCATALTACGAMGGGQSSCLRGAADGDKVLHPDWWDLASPETVQPFSNGAKFGLIGPGNTVIAPFVYDELAHSGEGSLIATCGGKEGLIDMAGTEFVPLKYEYVQPFSEGLAVAGTARQAGYIDPSGTEVIDLKFASAQSFSEGLAGAYVTDDQAGYIDATGEFVIAPVYYSVSPFSEGRAAVQVSTAPPASGDPDDIVAAYDGANAPTGYIDRSGTMIIDPQFYMAEPFQDGWARVSATVTHPDCPEGPDETGYRVCEGAVALDGSMAVPIGAFYVYRTEDGHIAVSDTQNLTKLVSATGETLVDWQENGFWGIEEIMAELAEAQEQAQGQGPEQAEQDDTQ